MRATRAVAQLQRTVAAAAARQYLPQVARSIRASACARLARNSGSIVHVRTYAVSTTPASSIKDPAEEEVQRQLEIGSAALEAGNIADARLAYEKAIAITESPSAHFNLGVCHYHENNFDKAIEAWHQTVRLSPESADAHTNLANAYVMSVPSRPDLAVEHLKNAARITPSDPEVQFNLGAVLEACEQLEEAAKAYERARSGGVERAMENIRNVKAKILAVKAGPRPDGLDEADKILRQRAAESKGGE